MSVFFWGGCFLCLLQTRIPSSLSPPSHSLLSAAQLAELKGREVVLALGGAVMPEEICLDGRDDIAELRTLTVLRVDPDSGRVSAIRGSNGDCRRSEN